MKQFISIFVVLTLSAMLLAGCGTSNAAPNSGTTSAEPNSSADVSASAPEAAQTIKAGTWLAYGAGEYTYYFFDADGTSGRTLRQADGMGIPFTYEVQGDEVTFCMGSPDTPAPGTLTVTDDEHIILQWKEGIQEELTYISDETSDTFQFFSDEELSGMALEYCKAHAESTDDLANLTAAAAANEDGSVSIQVYENLGDHNSNFAFFTVDRQTAAGTNDMTGEAIDLNN